jgi:hypothetical protein
MNSCGAVPISTFSDMPVILADCDIVAGQLTDIIDPDGLDISLASIGLGLYEVPRPLVRSLRHIVGKRIYLASIGGQLRFAEVRSS